MRKTDIVVIDYGVGNLRSVTNALERLGCAYTLSDRPEDIERAVAYILPGVGAFAEAMQNLHNHGIIDILRREVVEKKKPLLGICLGMQVLAEGSTEGGFHKGLGWIPGHVDKISGEGVRVPHVGWNDLVVCTKEPLFLTLPEAPRFYFDHSYRFEVAPEYIAATCSYGGEIVAAVQKGNIFGVQFHPEKSQNSGLRLIRAFINYVG